MASPATPSSPDAHSPPALPSLALLPDHILEDILLRLPTADDIDSASMAGNPFRRIIATRSFLLRFRALHRPSLLGVLAYESAQSSNLSVAFLPAQPPHPSAAAAARIQGQADFSCAFLPSPELWRNCDSRDGRILLSKKGEFLANLVVCDPLHRRYFLIPALPDDRTALARELNSMAYDPFLAPAGEDEDFRVMCLRIWCSTKLLLFIFSSSGAHAGQWHTVTFHGWADFMAGYVGAGYHPALPMSRHYAHGCFYWGPCNHKLLAFDARTEVFSSLGIPDGRYQMVFVEAREGRLGMFSRRMLEIFDDDGKHLLYDVLRDNEDGTRHWQMEGVIMLPYNNHFNIIGVAGGSLLLLHGNLNNQPDSSYSNCNSCSVDLETLKLEWFCGTDQYLRFSPHTHLYEGFPPSLSPPTISMGLNLAARQG